jgi:hypothetical protein
VKKKRSDLPRIPGVVMTVGIVLAMAPLFGVITAVVSMLLDYEREFGALALNAAALRRMRMPLRPIIVGFAVFPAGLLIVALALWSFAARLKIERAPRPRDDAAS